MDSVFSLWRRQQQLRRQRSHFMHTVHYMYRVQSCLFRIKREGWMWYTAAPFLVWARAGLSWLNTTCWPCLGPTFWSSYGHRTVVFTLIKWTELWGQGWSGPWKNATKQINKTFVKITHEKYKVVNKVFWVMFSIFFSFALIIIYYDLRIWCGFFSVSMTNNFRLSYYCQYWYKW